MIESSHTAGYHLTYLPKYMLSSDEELQQSDEYFKDRFLDGLKRMIPDFDQSKIIDVHVNRAMKVQPLLVLNYSSLVAERPDTSPGLLRP